MSKRAFLLTLSLTVMTGAVFALWPQLDPAFTRALHGEGGFAGSGNAARMLRSILYWVPVTVMGFMVLARFAPTFGFRLPSAMRPTNKSLIIMAFGLALGPGLVVNLGLKEYSGRPRPAQVREFGGAAEFRPWYSFDGSCRSNCSFVSGEVAASAWLVAPASLAPPPWRAPAMVAAFLLTAATGLLRMAFGAHFLSDVLFAALLTLLICQALRLLLLPGKNGAD